MILDEFVEILITNRNLTYYREKGHDFCINTIYKVSVSDLNENSKIKVNVECDICKIKNLTPFLSYNKSISRGGYYSCKKCRHNKREKDWYKISKYISDAKKKKYDKITNEIEDIGNLECNKCKVIQSLDNFRKNRNGRYIRDCKKCRSDDFKIYYNNLDGDIKRTRKRQYYRNSIQLNLWRSILKAYLFRRSEKKIAQTIESLGYSSLQLRNHLESKFDENMNWDNYGTYWHVDHIIPISIFKEDTPIAIVNSLCNLRPFEKYANFQKGDKLDEESMILIDDFRTYLREECIIEKKNIIWQR